MSPPGGETGQRAVDDFFDRQARIWSCKYYGDSGSLGHRVERFAGVLAATCPAPASILDFGCGTGELARALAGRGYRVAACDRSAAMIAEARARDAGSVVSWSVLAGDDGGGDRAAPAGVHDAVVCSSVLEYVEDPGSTLRALRERLSPGGVLLATVPDVRHPIRRRERPRRWLARRRWFRAIVARTRWADTYELLWLSRQWLDVERWRVLGLAAGFEAMDREPADHPLAMLVFRRGS